MPRKRGIIKYKRNSRSIVVGKTYKCGRQIFNRNPEISQNRPTHPYVVLSSSSSHFGTVQSPGYRHASMYTKANNDDGRPQTNNIIFFF